ncbi:SAM-dependent methyltransferase [Nonomuraea sp. SYSU D8015]|uniref:SAM-dependent methyltransferase n=1 Tax=Nonomuraea sp. SYSU D8015 TaxID=2593644 RepID=UPI0016615BA1|nr:SAM-dependent methyltransferase [Nonomuraea sp. SYSU D8015]
MTSEPTIPGQLSGIGATALGVAFLRARENRRPDRLFADPYAELFLAAVAASSPWAGGNAAEFLQVMTEQVSVRTRFLDDALLAAARGGCDQVVLLACGMDARAYRLAWPAGVTVFELDFPDVLAFKAAVLAQHDAKPAGHRVEVPVDLRLNWPDALTEAGFDPRRSTAWLAEGILYALPAEAADLFLNRITELSAPGSVLALDHMEDSPTLRAARAKVSPELVTMWQGGPAEPLDAWLRRHTWNPTMRDLTDLTSEHGRPVPPPFDPARPDTGRGWLVTAHLPSSP